MLRLLTWVQLFCLAAAGFARSPSAEATSDWLVRRHLRARLEHPSRDSRIAAGGEALYSREVLPAFYEMRLFQPAWSDGSRPSSAAKELGTVIRKIASQGLVPADYHLQAIEELLAAGSRADPAALADLDLLLTDAFLILGAHIVSGRVDPETFDAEWIAARREVDLGRALATALADQAPRAVLEGLNPDHPGYSRLRRALAHYRELAGRDAWPAIAPGAALRPGDSNHRVLQLRARLAVTDAAPEPATGGELYDEQLAEIVRRFQERHGLTADGVVGDKTRTALNVTPDERVEQIELNLERWRWLPQHLGERYLIVNIPDFSLALVDREEPQLGMRVAVGRSYRRTPVFSDAVRYLVLNPYWDVPHRLAVQDKLPVIQTDPTYLARLGFRVYQGWDPGQKEVDPATLNWLELGPGRFPYRLRQDPGPLNALGRVKFMFPNRFNVYLHDTPERSVFERAERDVSSGCIRVEKPLELAELLLASSPRWSRESIAAALATGRETMVPLPSPVPVHLQYWTAWAAEDGTVHFRRDIYGRDALLAQALSWTPAAAQREAGP